MNYDPSPVMLNGSPLCVGVIPRHEYRTNEIPSFTRHVGPPDGEPIGKHRIARIEADVERCLRVGAWSVAVEVVRRARTRLVLSVPDSELLASSDGPFLYGVDRLNPKDRHNKVDYHAAVVARTVGVHLLRGSVTTAIESLRTTLERLTQEERSI